MNSEAEAAGDLLAFWETVWPVPPVWETSVGSVTNMVLLGGGKGQEVDRYSKNI